MLQQLSLVGPPVEPAVPRGRDRLQHIVHLALASHFAGSGLDADAIHHAAAAVTNALARTSPKLNYREMLLRLSGGRPTCWLCGNRIDLDAEPDSDGRFSIDHVVPRSRGGASLGIENLRPAHRICNHSRGDGSTTPRKRARLEAFLATFDDHRASA